MGMGSRIIRQEYGDCVKQSHDAVSSGVSGTGTRPRVSIIRVLVLQGRAETVIATLRTVSTHEEGDYDSEEDDGKSSSLTAVECSVCVGF